MNSYKLWSWIIRTLTSCNLNYFNCCKLSSSNLLLAGSLSSSDCNSTSFSFDLIADGWWLLRKLKVFFSNNYKTNSLLWWALNLLILWWSRACTEYLELEYQKGLQAPQVLLWTQDTTSSISNDVLIYYSVAVLKRRAAEKCAAVLFIIQGLAGVSWLSIFTFVVYL